MIINLVESLKIDSSLVRYLLGEFGTIKEFRGEVNFCRREEDGVSGNVCNDLDRVLSEDEVKDGSVIIAVDIEDTESMFVMTKKDLVTIFGDEQVVQASLDTLVDIYREFGTLQYSDIRAEFENMRSRARVSV